MSKWAQAKRILELNWRLEWREIAQGTMGELDQDALREVSALVDQLEAAYFRMDHAGFLVLKDQLVKHRSWTGSKPSCAGNPDAKSAKPTGAPTVLALPI